MAITQGTWGPQTGVLGFLNPFSRDAGFTEKLPSSYNNPAVYINPNQPSPAYNIYGQPNYSIPQTSLGDTSSSNKTALSQQKQIAPSGSVQASIPSNPTNNNNQVPTNNDIMNEINNLYGPSVGLLNQQEALAGQQKATAIQGVNDNTDYLKNQLTTNQESLNRSVESNTQSLFEGNRSALDQARRDFSALQQQAQSRFGLGTGAGAFISDLQGQEMLRNEGNLHNSYNQNLAAIQDFSLKAQKQTMDELNNVDREHQTALKQVDDNFNARLLQISQDRTTLEQAKTQQKIDLLRESQSYIRQINAAREEALFNVANWSESQKSQVSSALTQLQNNYSNMTQDQADNRTNATKNQSYSQLGGGESNKAQTTFANPYLTSTRKTYQDNQDEFNIDSYFA